MHGDSHRRPAPPQAMGYGTAHGAHGSVPSWGPSGAAVYSLTGCHACKYCNSVASVTTLGSQRICLSSTMRYCFPRNSPSAAGWPKQKTFSQRRAPFLARPKIRSGTRCFGHRARVQQPERERNQQPGCGCRQAACARARIQQNYACASSQISEFRSCMHSVSWIHARLGGWLAAHAMI